MKKSRLVCLILLTFLITSCTPESTQIEEPVTRDESAIAIHPPAFDYDRGALPYLPYYDPDSSNVWQIDLRGYDLSGLNIGDRIDDLMYADFDTNTKWPEAMPEEFDPEKIMDFGKNPGLNIRNLHKKGVMGKGIGIGIIDNSLLVDHVEYKNRLRLYEEFGSPDGTASLHGAAVASIAAGKTSGVAPCADLYYIGASPGYINKETNSYVYDLTYYAKAVNRMLDVNESLPEENKLRVISISFGWGNPPHPGFDEFEKAMKRAEEQGVFIITTSLLMTHGYYFNGLGRSPVENPDKYTSFAPGNFWSKTYYEKGNETYKKIEEEYNVEIDEVLYVPMDSRAFASPTGNEDYLFCRAGGWSWSVPYIAGLYVLACQVNPAITPDLFLQQALKTGDILKIEKDGKKYELNKIVNPVKLINNIKK